MILYPCFILVLLHSVFSQTTDKYSDEDRPYKFGFNIQGYQHRQEEKDERGLIKGEYGFITADGYYRVTVYATDENGDFRIISMKNYYVGFPPEDPTTTPGPSGGSARAPLPGPAFNARQGATGKALEIGNGGGQKPAKPFVRPQGLAACSDCSIPTTTVRTNQGIGGGDFRNGRTEGDFGAPGFGRSFGGNQSPQFPQGSPQSAFQSPGGGQSPQGISGRSGQGLLGGQPPQGTSGGSFQGAPGKSSQFSPGAPGSITPTSGVFGSTGPTGPGSSFGGGNQPTRGGGFGSGDPNFPKGRNDFTRNNQLGDSPRQRPQIGEVREGLPPGVTLNDIKDLLYTFNYTVGFHGHHEDGYRNGDKQGDYFFDGRDGVERKVEYLANEFGYQPNITLIDLPENDVRRPNEQTEKEYGLKGYEFKWFYRK